MKIGGDNRDRRREAGTIMTPRTIVAIVAMHPKCNLVGTPGNHEFDEGKDELFRLLNGGNHAGRPFP
jgi:hypothetical protein